MRRGLQPVFDSPRVISQSLTTFSQVAPDDVIKLGRNSSAKSCVFDVLPPRIVKDNTCLLAPFLTSLFNSSLALRVELQDFQIALIKPLFKKVGLDQNVLNKYLPVFNLPFLSKLLERIGIIANQLGKFLSWNGLYAKFQSAYRANLSTETALLKVHNDVMVALDSKKGRYLNYARSISSIRYFGPLNPSP